MKHKSCLDNLKICKGECCKYFVFNVEMDDEMRRYYNLHKNTKAIGDKVFIMNKCKHLTKEGKCAVYNSPDKPKLCSMGYTETMDGFNCPESCIYNESNNPRSRKRRKVE